MGLARHLEERLERLVDGVSAALFRGKMRPVELASRLVRFADLRVEETWLGPTIPNVYRLFVAEADLGTSEAAEEELAALSDELAHALRATAADSGWATGGPISVTVEPSASGSGTTTVQALTQPGPIRHWGQLIALRGSAVHGFGDNRVGIGRGDDVEVSIDVPEISRHHAVVIRQGGGYWIADAGSTNGTWHNEERTGNEPVRLRPGDMLQFGPATFTFRIL